MFHNEYDNVYSNNTFSNVADITEATPSAETVTDYTKKLTTPIDRTAFSMSGITTKTTYLLRANCLISYSKRYLTPMFFKEFSVFFNQCISA